MKENNNLYNLDETQWKHHWDYFLYLISANTSTSPKSYTLNL